MNYVKKHFLDRRVDFLRHKDVIQDFPLSPPLVPHVPQLLQYLHRLSVIHLWRQNICVSLPLTFFVVICCALFSANCLLMFFCSFSGISGFCFIVLSPFVVQCLFLIYLSSIWSLSWKTKCVFSSHLILSMNRFLCLDNTWFLIGLLWKRRSLPKSISSHCVFSVCRRTAAVCRVLQAALPAAA